MSQQAKPKLCVDCPIPARPSAARHAPHPGPRCTTHHRAVKKVRKDRAHEAHVIKTYHIPAGYYERLLAYQGNKCAICQKSTGARKRLAVDHDHKKETDNVRGILCGICNMALARFRDDPEWFRRAANYLEYPPAYAFNLAED